MIYPKRLFKASKLKLKPEKIQKESDAFPTTCRPDVKDEVVPRTEPVLWAQGDRLLDPKTSIPFRKLVETDDSDSDDSFPEPVSDDDLYSSDEEIDKIPENATQLPKRLKGEGRLLSSARSLQIALVEPDPVSCRSDESAMINKQSKGFVRPRRFQQCSTARRTEAISVCSSRSFACDRRNIFDTSRLNTCCENPCWKVARLSAVTAIPGTPVTSCTVTRGQMPVFSVGTTLFRPNDMSGSQRSTPQCHRQWSSAG
ncbi:hypothetical protein KQX54_016848 [Cotesia glomerata]|uniref:Uncharacterized protein n=1 Tax=Cotesia glomerata TaxID=32391 RepID=A0AAV7HYT4_COTGL|nr:hypothetical protein KQX54_016848 [Cotesia glomerata]